LSQRRKLPLSRLKIKGSETLQTFTLSAEQSKLAERKYSRERCILSPDAAEQATTVLNTRETFKTRKGNLLSKL